MVFYPDNNSKKKHHRSPNITDSPEKKVAKRRNQDRPGSNSSHPHSIHDTPKPQSLYHPHRPQLSEISGNPKSPQTLILPDKPRSNTPQTNYRQSHTPKTNFWQSKTPQTQTNFWQAPTQQQSPLCMSFNSPAKHESNEWLNPASDPKPWKENWTTPTPKPLQLNIPSSAPGKLQGMAKDPKRRLRLDLFGDGPEDKDPNIIQFDVIFLGTGPSSRVPMLGCKPCEVCKDAENIGSKNRRMNTCLAIRQVESNLIILIDCGKTFYNAAMTLLKQNRIDTVDALLLSHIHEDTVSGLDDLRGLMSEQGKRITIFLTDDAMQELTTVKRFIVESDTTFQFQIIKRDQQFRVFNMQFTPLPVYHGRLRDDPAVRFQALGFRFGQVCYMSDVDKIPESTHSLLKNCKLLIIDARCPRIGGTGHFGYKEALHQIRRIRAGRTLLTGLSHDMDYFKMTENVSGGTYKIALAYDGLKMRFPET